MNLIYKAISPSNKIYIGLTNNLTRRISEHKKSSKNEKDKDYNSPFHRAIRKYGFENIKWEILENDISDEMIKNKEIEWINRLGSYRNGYNATLGGDRGLLGYKHSDETKQKIGNRFYPKGQEDPKFGRKRSKEIRMKITKNHANFKKENHPRYNKNITIDKIINCLSDVGTVAKAANILNVSKSFIYNRLKINKNDLSLIKKHDYSGKNNPNYGKKSFLRKKIKCVETNEIFNSIREAALFFKGSEGHLSNHLSNRCKSYKGYTFVYE